MSKDTYPVQLIIHGEVEAYSDEQIRDDVREIIYDVNKEMFGTRNMQFQLRVGEKELLYTGITREKLISKIAQELFEDRQGFCRSVSLNLQDAIALIQSVSGWIFKHEGSEMAVGHLKKYIELLGLYNKEWKELTDEERWPFIRRATEIASSTVWYHVMIKEK